MREPVRFSNWEEHVLLQCVILASGFANGMAQDGKDNPRDAPEGMKRQSLTEIEGSICLPEDWHFSTTEAGGTLVYRLSKERTERGKFMTGLTINVLRDVRKRTRVPASYYAAHRVNQYVKGKSVVSTPITPRLIRSGQSVQITCDVIRTMPDLDPQRQFRIRLVVLGDDQTDTVYYMIFGSPKEDWQENEQVARRMLQELVIAGEKPLQLDDEPQQDDSDPGSDK